MKKMYLTLIKLPSFNHKESGYYPCILTTMRTISGTWAIGFAAANDRIEEIKRYVKDGFDTLCDTEEEAQALLDDLAALRGLEPYEIRRMES